MSKFLHRFWISAVLLLAVGLCACGGSSVPVIQSAELFSYSEGSVSSQYLVIDLTLDEPATGGEKPRIKIAGQNVKDSEIESEAEGGRLTLTIRVEQVRDGDLTLSLSDKDGAQTLEALVPSGFEFAQVGKDEKSVSVEVTHTFDIRSIAWIVLTDGGEPVGDSLMKGADLRDGAIALHGHEFLSDDEYDVAANLADAITGHFGDRYTATLDGKIVKIGRADGTDADIEIEIYSYVRVV